MALWLVVEVMGQQEQEGGDELIDAAELQRRVRRPVRPVVSAGGFRGRRIARALAVSTQLRLSSGWVCCIVSDMRFGYANVVDHWCQMKGGVLDSAKMDVLLDRVEASIQASYEVNLELVGLVRTVIREATVLAPIPPEPPTQPKKVGRSYLDTVGAADMLGISNKTMEKWRWQGGGPPYIKMGSGVRYDPLELEEWVRTRRRRHTSDPGPGA